MNILPMLDKLAQVLRSGWPKEKATPPVVPLPYPFPLFKRAEDEAFFQANGYVVLPVLPADVIEELKELYQWILTRLPDGVFSHRVWNSGACQDYEIRKRSIQLVGERCRPFFAQHFNLEAANPLVGVLLAKRGKTGDPTDPHQDDSEVDEQAGYYSLVAWCPLMDINEENGVISVVPGSHRLGNHIRSIEMPWEFQPYIKEMTPLYRAIPVKAGEAIMWHPALLHGSTANTSDQDRLAVRYSIHPKGATLRQYFWKKDMPNGMVRGADIDYRYHSTETEAEKAQYYHDLGLVPDGHLGLSRRVFVERMQSLLPK
jgi:hypothetical protein